jgi:hypothetical protein
LTVDAASTPGDPLRRNEDYAGTADGVVVVLDGVTPPPDGEDGCVHGVAWFVEQLGPALVRIMGARRDVDLTACLAEAIEETAGKHRETCDLSHRLTPQATVAVFRWDDETVEYLVLSDAAILLLDRDDVVTPVLDDRLDRLRERPELRGNTAAWTALRNSGDGFFTAAADPAVARRAVTGRSPRAELRAVAAMTDGVTRWVDVFGLGDWAGLFEVLRHEGGGALIEQVRAAESADPDRTAFRRGKTHDDATVALLAW